jgi:predicted kinase
VEAAIFVGIQASGKSSFYRKQFFDTHLRINLDMLKTRHRERILLRACIEAKQPFVVDNTNPTIEERARYIEIARSGGFRVVGYYFRSPPKEALTRNARLDGQGPHPG